MTQAENINQDPIDYCANVILKEARMEDKLVRQLLYAMFSAYTNNPLNLAINSPSGEGKNWVITHVAEKFPSEDIIILSGMSPKSVFHKRGISVIKNAETGRYEPLDNKLAELDSDIQDKELEKSSTQSAETRKGLKAAIRELERDKSKLRSESKKLIDLSHKMLIFLDTPPPELLSALMSMLAHDEYETEYEYVDTSGQIGTKTNVLRGWPVFIFAQASDLGHYRRYKEIQRRFIFTNPRMDTVKYEAAIDLIVDSHGIPDFMYNATVIDERAKDRCKETILQTKSDMQELTSRLKPNKNQKVFCPFNDAIKSAVPKTKGLDMTTAKRIMSFLSLIPLVKISNRPRLASVSSSDGKGKVEVTPIVLFEDLSESINVVEASSGLRPYQTEWYEKVFCAAYNSMTQAESRIIKGQEVTEKIIAVTTQLLSEKTEEVYKRKFTSKQILEGYLEPLLNEGYIDRTSSDLDHRAYIYYPMIDATKLFDYSIRGPSNNYLHKHRIVVRSPSIYPNKDYIISKFQDIERYSISQGLKTTIKDYDWTDLTSEQLINKYYNDPSDCFDLFSDSQTL